MGLLGGGGWGVGVIGVEVEKVEEAKVGADGGEAVRDGAAGGGGGEVVVIGPGGGVAVREGAAGGGGSKNLVWMSEVQLGVGRLESAVVSAKPLYGFKICNGGRG